MKATDTGDKVTQDIAELELRREALYNDIQAHAEHTGDTALQWWLIIEARKYLQSVKTMSKAYAKLGKARERDIQEPSELLEHTRYINRLQNIARIEAEIHREYLEKTIADLQGKKKALGIK